MDGKTTRTVLSGETQATNPSPTLRQPGSWKIRRNKRAQLIAGFYTYVDK